jgi:hypothetical protein
LAEGHFEILIYTKAIIEAAVDVIVWQLDYRAGQFYWWRKQKRSTDLSQSLTNFIIVLYRVHLA